MNTWNPPETAPQNGTSIIADFGWPWPVVAIWCNHTEQWAIAQLAPCLEHEELGWETEWEPQENLRQWIPMPYLPKSKKP